MKERRDIQKTVVEYLVSIWPGKTILTTAEVREALSLTVDQMKQTKDALVKKGLAIDHGRGLIGLGNLSPEMSQKHICSHLTRKTDDIRADELYCPLKRTFIAEKDKNHFCGKMMCVRFKEGKPELFYKANCENWSGTSG